MNGKVLLGRTLTGFFLLLILTAALIVIFAYNALFTDSLQVHREAYMIVAVLIFFGLVLVAAVGFYGLRSIRLQLKQLRYEAARFANGDLSRRIEMQSNDEIGELATTFNEMSERLRESYQRLALEKQRDEILLESIGEGMIALDTKGQIVLINNNAIDVLELEEKELAGEVVHKLFALESSEEKKLRPAERPEMKALHKGEPQNEVCNFRSREGKKVVLNINASPVFSDGNVEGAIVVIRDVTHEKEVDRMKTEFISLASHQLRTPLSAIRWFTEMLLSGDAGKLKSEQQEFAKNIYDSCERMIDLVGSLLNISRIESGRIIVDPKPTDLRELVGGIINDLKAKTEEKEQKMIISVHRDLPKINLDPHLIGQVYLNLLTNAIKYTQKGGEIMVFISRKDDHIISQVTDNGYGIPKQEQKKVFQKFFRAENAVKVETDGTGLGLYLIKAIIESSGGEIWFESEVGVGTTFWFSIPMSGMKAKTGEVTLDS
ncbi:MAG TPA: ATP-binding protein [Candidatus Saccharimonadales bacterium]